MNTVTALNILKSWLRANKLAYSKAEVPGVDILVEGPTACAAVRVVQGIQKPIEGVIDVSTDDIGHDDLDTALAAYHVVTRAVGAGEPKPFDRGVEPTRNFYGDEPFLTDVRHTEVRRSPNPSPEKFRQYDKVMHKAVWTFYNVNRDFCRRMGLAVEDLMTYAQTMLISFCARQEREDRSQDENEIQLYVYLRQRFAEKYKTSTKRERSIVPDADTVSIGLLDRNYRNERGRPVDFEYENDPRDVEGDELMLRLMGSKGSVPATDLAYRQRRRQLDCSNPGKRKASATKMLEEKLASLDHDDLVRVLAAAKTNILIHPDARREASKRLIEHEDGCETCKMRLAKHKTSCRSCNAKRTCNAFYSVSSPEIDVDEESAVDGPSFEE